LSGFYMSQENRIEIVLPLPPSVNSLWRTGPNGRVYVAPRYKVWKTSAAWEIAAQARGQKIKGEYRMILRAVPPDARKRDLDNLLKAASDVLQAAGVIENDHYCRELIASWETEGPQCRIIVEAINPP